MGRSSCQVAEWGMQTKGLLRMRKIFVKLKLLLQISKYVLKAKKVEYCFTSHVRRKPELYPGQSQYVETETGGLKSITISFPPKWPSEQN